jgi:PAS domain-containing protein
MMALYKHKMDRNLREQKDWLESVLNSISEAIITTDRLGRVGYMNNVAEGLTG